MKVQFSLVGAESPRPDDVTLDLPCVPRPGDVIHWPNTQRVVVVRAIDWFLTHDEEGEPLPEPFVYVVVGPPRP